MAADPEGCAVSPYGHVNVRRNSGRTEVGREQKVVPSQHEEDQMVLLPFPFLHLSQNGSEHERKFELLFARRPGGMVEKSSNPHSPDTPSDANLGVPIQPRDISLRRRSW